MKRIGLLASLVLTIGALSAEGAQASTVTVGSPLTASFAPQALPGVETTINSALPEPGAFVASPVTGTIVRWRITQATGGPFKLRVLRPSSGGTYTGAGTSAAQGPTSTATQTFSTSMSIGRGQVIGIDNATSTDQIGTATPVAGASYAYWIPPLASGTTRAPTATTASHEIGFNADVRPLPGVNSVHPSAGPNRGGTTVTIQGHDFEGATSVTFGTTRARSFTVDSDTLITAVSPARRGGTVNVYVRNPRRSSAVTADRFTFGCIVPRLRGKRLRRVKRLLRLNSCRLGRVRGPRRGRVVRQRPRAGRVLPAGSRVSVKLR